MAKKIKKRKKHAERAVPVKLSDAQFFSLLRENAGLFASTARAITAQFGIPYSRQAVHDRAHKYPKLLADIDEENIDIAEEGLHSLMRSRSEAIKADTTKFFLKHRGRKRGYNDKTDIELTGKDGKGLDFKILVDSKSVKDELEKLK
jgi:hypothetical protein